MLKPGRERWCILAFKNENSISTLFMAICYLQLLHRSLILYTDTPYCWYVKMPLLVELLFSVCTLLLSTLYSCMVPMPLIFWKEYILLDVMFQVVNKLVVQCNVSREWRIMSLLTVFKFFAQTFCKCNQMGLMFWMFFNEYIRNICTQFELNWSQNFKLQMIQNALYNTVGDV